MVVVIRATLSPQTQANANALLKELADKSANISGGLKIVGERLLREQNRRFDTQTDPAGRPWTPLSALTILTRGGASGPILRRSGQLKRSGAWQVAGLRLSVGVNTIYAAAQQFGVTIVPKKAKRLAIPLPAGAGGRNGRSFAFAKKITIPPRPIVGFGPRDEIATRNAIVDWLAVPGKGIR